jgi:phosphate transport system ATP-binding protein
MENIETRRQESAFPPVAFAALEDTPAQDAGRVPRTATVARDKRDTVGEVRVDEPRIRCNNVDVYYGDKRAINSINLDIGRNEVIALIGPSGCGKSTFLRCLNRMNDTIDSCRVTGDIVLDGVNINDG